MEKWQKDLWEMVQTVADEVERFFTGMTEVVDTLIEVTEEFSEQVQTALVTEVDQYLQDLAEPILEVYWEFEEILTDDIVDSGFPYPVAATKEKNPACIGCRHYHGQAYANNLLVCGMHPYGWEDENCPDWEQEEL